MKFNLTLILGLLLLSFISYGQSSTIKIIVLDKKTKEAVGNRDISVTINDTLTKTVKLNVDGEAERINIDGGFYKMQFKIDQYETLTLKKVGIDGARGRILIIKINPTNNKK